MGDVEERDSDVESGGTFVDRHDRDPGPGEKTFPPPEPDAAEARAFRAQKRRLLAQMFGAQIDEPEDGSLGGVFGHYVLLGELGDGGMGRVYEAYDRSLDRKVAIKTLLELDDDPHLHARLVREAKAMARLTHPNVVRVYEIAEAEAGPYIVMEFIQGQTLREWLDERERSRTAILEVFRAVGRGLAAIHAAGLIHRDVKPDNIMINEDGRALVMDLGVVHSGVDLDLLMPEHPQRSDGELELHTRTGAMIGTPHYMAPEQFDSLPITDRADQYSFCVSLWEAAYGERPVRGGSLTELVAAVKGGHRSEPKPSRAPAWLRAVLERGLAIEADKRFASMQDLVDALAEPQRRWGTLAIVMLVAATLGVGAYGLERWNEARAPRLLDGEADMDQLVLLPRGRGIVYTNDGALWHRELDSKDARKLHDEALRIMLASNASRDGSVFYQIVTRDLEWELYRLRDVDEEPTRIRGFPGGSFCPLVDHGLAISAWQPAKAITLHHLVGDRLTESRDVPLDGEFTWITGVACDDVNGRVAILTRDKKRFELHIVDVAGGEGHERIALEDGVVHSPQFGEDGDELFYLINRGRGFELESRRLAPGGQSTSTSSASGGHEFRAFALSPDGRIAYTSRARPHTTLRLLASDGVGKDGHVALAGAARVHEIPADVTSVVLSPDERTLAYVEQGEGDVDTIQLIDLEVGLASWEPRELWKARGLGTLAWSPDGGQLAYLAETEGSVRIWSIGLDGDLSAMLSTSEASESKHMSWLPSGELMFQMLGNQNYVVFEPTTKAERPLIENDDVGWCFAAVPAHGGREVAVNWNRLDRGLWTIDVVSGDERLIVEGKDLWPFAWSKDDAYIFAQTTEEPGVISRVPAAGGEPEAWRTIDFGTHEHTTDCSIMFANGDLLCQTTEWDEHLWLANSPKVVSLEHPDGEG